MIYSYSYITESNFYPAIERHFFKLRALPCENEFQRVLETKLEIQPACPLYKNKDGLGNEVQWGSFEKRHDLFRIISSGCVEQLRPYLIGGEPEPYYNAFTHLTESSLEMYCIADRILGKRRESTFKIATRLMHWVHRFLQYVPGSTTVATTAAEVLHQPNGVCQDYAHLMIALCRCRGIYARYVNGLIAGQGQTHAWVEVSNGKEWRAFDPTNDLEIEWGYIKIAHGRDADDCPTNRGRFFGWTQEYMRVETCVEEVVNR